VFSGTRAAINDDAIIKQRIAGRSVRANCQSAAQINEAIDDKIRKNTLALELARLHELQETSLWLCQSRAPLAAYSSL
jgi:hypothetical protein